MIERDWFQPGEWKLDRQFCCKACGVSMRGVFEVIAEIWVRQRQVVRINDI